MSGGEESNRFETQDADLSEAGALEVVYECAFARPAAAPADCRCRWGNPLPRRQVMSARQSDELIDIRKEHPGTALGFSRGHGVGEHCLLGVVDGPRC